MPNVVAHDSNENIWVRVRSEHPLTGAADLSGYPVEVAITVSDPESADWKAATWETGTETVGGKVYYLARLEIGPNGGAVTLDDNTTYQVRARVTASGEKPIVYAGSLQAF